MKSPDFSSVALTATLLGVVVVTGSSGNSHWSEPEDQLQLHMASFRKLKTSYEDDLCQIPLNPTISHSALLEFLSIIIIIFTMKAGVSSKFLSSTSF